MVLVSKCMSLAVISLRMTHDVQGQRKWQLAVWQAISLAVTKVSCYSKGTQGKLSNSELMHGLPSGHLHVQQGGMPRHRSHTSP